MNEQAQKLLDELVSKIENKEEFEAIREQLFKRGVESLLNAELTAHLGHPKSSSSDSGNIRNGYSEKTLKTVNGDQRIKVPRDRESSFDPVTVPKHQSMSQEIEDSIMLLYAKGMSNADIIDFIEQT